MTRHRGHFGSRLLAFAGLWLLLSGLAAALSFVIVAVVATAVLVALVAAAAAVAVLWRLDPARRLGAAVGWAVAAIRGLTRRLRDSHVRRRIRRPRLGQIPRPRLDVRPPRLGRIPRPRLDVRAQRLGRIPRPRLDVRPPRLGQMPHARLDVRDATERLRERAPLFVARVLRAYAVTVYRLQLRASRAVVAGARIAGSLPGVEVRPVGGIREAQRLNNLAVALAQAGAEAEAVEHLEHARVVLHELGDEEHEAEVIANLGMVHRRQGHSEEAVNLLHEALAKLPPESSAYRRVEEELLRAS